MKRIISLILSFILITLCLNIPVIAADERWIEVTVGELYTVKDILDEDYERSEYIRKYYVYPEFDYGTSYSFIASFDDRYLNNIMPNIPLTGKKIKIKVLFNGINQTSKTVWNVIDYELNETSEANLVAKILKMYYYAEDSLYYYAEGLDNSIFLLKFPRTMSGVRDLEGQTLSLYTGNKYLYHGKSTYDVTNYTGYKADKDNPDLYNPEIKEYYGILQEVYLNEYKNNKISYIVKDSNGDKEYIAHFELEDTNFEENLYSYNEYEENGNNVTQNQEKIFISTIPETIDEYQTGRKIKIYGYKEGTSENKDIIIVKDYLFLEDNFTRYDKENVYLTGKIQLNIKSDTKQTIYSMRTNDTANALYYLIFDQQVLGETMPTVSLLDKEISVYGVSYKQGNDYYIGVMSYGFPTSDLESEENSNYTIKEVSFSTIVDETNNTVSYYGIDTNLKKETYVFDKNILGRNMPVSSLTNKTYTIAYIKTENYNSVLAWTEIIKNNQDYYEKGILIKRLNKNQTSSEYLFQNSYGEQLTAIIPIELENNLLSEKEQFQDKQLTNKTVYLFGTISTFDGDRRLLVKDLEITNELYINKTTADVITFTGTISSIVSEKLTGIMYNINNQYEQNTIIYFDKEILGNNYPQESLLGKELTIRGLKYSNGILLVTDFNNVTQQDKYPIKPTEKYTNPVDFPNMEGFTGVISTLNIDKTYYTLITSKARYILTFEDKNIEKILQENLSNTVYLRGQPDVVGQDFWSNRIKVYDIQPVCLGKNNCTTIINPVNDKIPEQKTDPQKNAIHTIQINEADPKKYNFGLGILESLTIPDINIDLSKTK